MPTNDTIWGDNTAQNDSKPYEGEIERKNNNIYFYSSISRNSIQKLVSLLDDVERDNIWNQTSKEMKEKDPIKVYINSPGGTVFSSLDAFNKMESMNGKIITINNGAIASGGSLLFLAGDERICGKYSFFLIHQLSGCNWGTFENQKDNFVNNQKQMDALYSIYKEKTKMSMKEIKDLLKRDIYLTAQECLERGIATRVV
jgi:ATP-dependent Clp endopeptidase proteolytic subunit ClpP